MSETTHISIDEIKNDPAAFRRVLLVPTDTGPKPLAAIVDDWQLCDFEACDNGLRIAAGLPSLAGSPKWSRVYLERPRGHSKTTDLATMVLWCLFAAKRPLRGFAAAADKDQAGLLLDSIRLIAAANPWLDDHIEIQKHKVICHATGATLEVMASDVASSWGLRPDFVVCDELTHWAKRDLFDSLLSSAAKIANCMMVVITNAGVGQGVSWQWKLREAIRDDADWYFSRQDGPVASWITEKNLAEQRRLLLPGAYARLWLNQWQSSTGDGLDMSQVERCVTLSGPHPGRLPGFQYVGGLDLGLKQDHAALVILAVGERYPAIHLASVTSWAPADFGGLIQLRAIEAEILRCRAMFGCRFYRYDPWQAEYLAQGMRNQGFHFDEWQATAGNLDLMATQLIQTFTSQGISLYDDPALTTDLARLTIQQRANGQFKLTASRDASGHCDRATALTLALTAAVQLQNEYFAPADEIPLDDNIYQPANQWGGGY